MNINWSALHPLVVHFPIVLLTVAPLYLIFCFWSRDWLRQFALPLSLLLLIGTVSAWAAQRSGHSAMLKADAPDAAEKTMEEHEELAEQVVWVTGALSVGFMFTAFVLARGRLGEIRALRFGALTVLLALNGYGAVQIARAAHLGGVLVHKYGVHAQMLEFAEKPPAEQGGGN